MFTVALEKHRKLSKRIALSKEKLANVIAEAAKFETLQNGNICIYVAGSLGRLECGRKSDLDVFVIADNSTRPAGTTSVSRLEEYEIFASLISLNSQLGFPKFSGDGRFLRIQELQELVKATGSPRDDSENLFTTRMLLVLESHAITNEQLYHQAVEKVADNYFRDSVGKKDFRPLFLLNDILRYWRTLCLNYEEHRLETTRPWWKKNLNLKFSRKLTIYSTVLALLSGRINSKEDFIRLTYLTPIQRMAEALDFIEDESLKNDFILALDDYECFLAAKENGQIEARKKKNKLDDAAHRFGRFFYTALESPRIAGDLKQYLII